MVYKQYKFSDKTFYSADPKNWEELAFTIAEEDPFMPYDPGNIEVDPSLLDMF